MTGREGQLVDDLNKQDPRVAQQWMVGNLSIAILGPLRTLAIAE